MAFAKHADVVAERFELSNFEFFVVRVHGVDQAIIFAGRQDRRNEKQAAFSALCEFIAEAGERRRGGGFAPVGRQIGEFDRFARQVVGKFADGENKIVGRIVLIQVNEIFEHGQRLVLGGIAEARARA